MNLFGVTAQKADALHARMEACGLREGDLRESFIRSGGPGGQKVNRSSTAVRLVHLPTGLEVKAQQDRSQALNRYYARRRLCELLEARNADPASAGASPQPTAAELEREKIRKQKARRRRRGSRPPQDGSSGKDEEG